MRITDYAKFFITKAKLLTSGALNISQSYVLY